MSKAKLIYVCQQCGAVANKWSGQCNECLAWGSLLEQQVTGKASLRQANYSGQHSAKVVSLQEVSLTQQPRFQIGLEEFDRVLGGGLVQGSVVLIGGDPGIGKSTVLLQVMAKIATQTKTLYVTGEESLQQVAMRAKRLALSTENINALSETCVEDILSVAKQLQPRVMVIDSIQTNYSTEIASAAGSVSQIRECAAKLVSFAKTTHTSLFLVGHVTKEGALAGPRVLEHMVDTVLYFEGKNDSRYRLIRAVKNRFGAVNELGIFAMTDRGLREVNNPSAIFLSRIEKNTCGSTVMATWEGSRPMLVELQALVDESSLANPRRVAVGVEQSRMTICLAVLSRHGGVQTAGQDVFINVVGGVRINETAADLALLMAVLSSLKNKPVPEELLVFGEIGLAGEVRPVQGGIERIREAAKHGFSRAIVPAANAKHIKLADMTITGISHIQQLLTEFSEL